MENEIESESAPHQDPGSEDIPPKEADSVKDQTLNSCGDSLPSLNSVPSEIPPPSSSSATSETKTSKDKDKDKINILLKPVGDAPILKNKLWAVPAERLVSQITEFVKKYLKLEKNQNLFFFVNQLFAPAPDQCLRDLYECFGSDGKLVLHYSTTVAWG